MSQATDRDLIDCALDGDRAAFGDLVRRYQDRLYHSLFHACGGAEEAQDVVQEAFIQAYVHLADFEGQSAFYTWLYRIAFNLMISRRRRARPVVSLDGEQARHEPVDGRAMPTAELERQDRIAQVRAALAEVGEDHRQVLVMREFEGWSYEAIAEVLGLPVGTVRSRLHRARMELRGLLAEVYQQEIK